MILENNQSGLVLGFYEASGDPEQWPQAIANLSALLDGVVINLWQYDHVKDSVEQKFDYGFDDESQPGLYDSETITKCNLFRRMVSLNKSHVYYWNDVISYDGLVNSRIWHEWASKLPKPHTTARLALNSTISYQLNTAHRTGFRSFEDGERRLWDQLILPHFWQALWLEYKLTQAKEHRTNRFDVLDRLSTAVVSLSDQGLVLDANRTASAILAQQDGISVHRKYLSCASQRESRELNNLIVGAGQTGLGNVSGCGGFMTVTRPSLKRPYHIAISPCLHGAKYGSGSKPPRVLMFIDDPEERPEAPIHVLQRLYGISPAQSRVLALLLKGLRREQIADELCLSQNTIKTHERDLFQSLDVSSRSELMRLTLPGLGSLRL